MVTYSCVTCYKTFDKKSNYKAHLARKIKCEPPSESDDSGNEIEAPILPLCKKICPEIAPNFSNLYQNPLI